ncbi:MAG: hypothetical protein KatS3mg068_1129 [Candidatus Sericytochromatia bacterium]|nr:MAG: hypothetical protein KatS3mg068_1129 [Candidatus Sericytochromatia bacterium]
MLLLEKKILKSAIQRKNKSIKKIIRKYINTAYCIFVMFLEDDKLARENLKYLMQKVYSDISNIDNYKSFYFWFYNLMKETIKQSKIKSNYINLYSKDNFIELYFKIHKIKYDDVLFNLFKEILNFSEEEKEIYILVEFEGLTCSQVSKLLNIPLEVVRYKLYSCKSILRKVYERT